MPEVQDTKRCPSCGKESVLYIYKRRGTWVTVKFWVNPYLPDEEVHYPFEDRKIPKGAIYEYRLRCPSCGEWFTVYNDVPRDVECYLAETSLICIPFDEIKEAIIATNLPGVEDRESRIACPVCGKVSLAWDPVCRFCGGRLQENSVALQKEDVSCRE